jgi:hypothetical protein
MYVRSKAAAGTYMNLSQGRSNAPSIVLRLVNIKLAMQFSLLRRLMSERLSRARIYCLHFTLLSS